MLTSFPWPVGRLGKRGWLPRVDPRHITGIHDRAKRELKIKRRQRVVASAIQVGASPDFGYSLAVGAKRGWLGRAGSSHHGYTRPRRTGA